MVRRARDLHARMLQAGLPPVEKSGFARRIAGLLFSAEAIIPATGRARQLFIQLRTRAHVVTLEGGARRSDENSIWNDYDDLEFLMASAASSKI